MSVVFKCDRCGQEMAGRQFLVNFFWKPCGDTEHEPQLYTEKELCPDCEEKIRDLIEGAKNTEQEKGAKK
jgi:Zn finger protein HypA/HybF involved in hydrogenase expression